MFNESEIAQFVLGIWEWQLGLAVQHSNRNVAREAENMAKGRVQVC